MINNAGGKMREVVQRTFSDNGGHAAIQWQEMSHTKINSP